VRIIFARQRDSEENYMKRIVVLALGVLVCASAAFADLTSSETKRLSDATTVVRELRGMPDKGIPEDTWNKAECIAVIPGMKKAAFLIGGEFGKGVISCRSGREWSAPVFIEMQKGSAGFQIGAEQVDLVLLMMNRNGVDKLLDNKVNLGADASVAAGPVGRTAAAATDGRLTAEILAYSRAKGAFAGIDISGGVLRPDASANAKAYGATVTPRDVLFTGNVAAPAPATAFLRTLKEESRATTGRKER
jgi:lipid-binding SYLF domain-containing protein